MINEIEASKMLKAMIGKDAKFRPGQYECIESIVNKFGKQLVVQKTGWGKSIVYFIATKYLRNNGSGPTLLISPLISLMRNQILNATKIGIKAECIIYANNDQWTRIKEDLEKNLVDILLVSPERLSNQIFLQGILPAMGNIGLFVVDEVHCISDWGHDFRPDYRRIKNLIQQSFSNIPVVGTTATANNRVVVDVEEQYGNNCTTHRGPLAREGLKLQNITLSSTAERLAWLLDNISKIKGSGIIYCLTKKDVLRVSEWLKNNNIDSHHYWGGDIKDDEGFDISNELEERLLNNNVKVLVATSALGMGFDKPDLSFVIHYQAPGSAVSYYQQVGRAGRAVPESYGILLHGNEEDEILDYFMKESFPSEEESNSIIKYLDTVEDANNSELKKQLNLKDNRVSKALKHLEIDGYIAKNGYKYSRTAKDWDYDSSRVEKIKKIRINERQRMKEYIYCESCLMKFIITELDDPNPEECGICSNCKKDYFPREASQENIFKALKFLNQDHQVIDPRKRWPAGIFDSSIIFSELHLNQGRAMCLLEDAGWGQHIKQCFQNNTLVSEDFLDAAVHLIKEEWNPDPFPDEIICIPSKNHKTMDDFCKRLSVKLNIKYPAGEFLDEYILVENEKPPQIEMNNSHQKVTNILDKWMVCYPGDTGGVCINDIKGDLSDDDGGFSGTKLLIDDFVDSRWTFTVVGGMLRRFGYTVYPFALGMKK
tara:strand:+ start:12655 stop:14790 length:2136 start_codon:yes stop_codon:yes gene_type:complete